MDALDQLTASKSEEEQQRIVSIEVALRANRTHAYELKTMKRAEEKAGVTKTVVGRPEVYSSVDTTSVLGAL